MVVRLTIAYLGTAYAGWQRQTNALSVQEVVEDGLTAILGRSVRLRAASRTDTGVHARGQVAHFELPVHRPLRALVHGTNRHLPPDVRVLAADRMPQGFDARFGNLGKEYRYRLRRADVIAPFEADRVVPVPAGFEPDRLRPVLEALPGRHDFTAFALEGGSHGDPRRRLLAASMVVRGPEIELRFVGTGFLRGMVRSLVGTLIEVGLDRRSPEAMIELLEGRPRSEAGPSAPARGLVLQRVFFPRRWSPLESFRADGLW